MYKILVIEDDKSLQKAILEKLKSSGFEATSASDGEKGLKMIQEIKPDLVILDLLIPKMDGMTVLKKIRSSNAPQKDMPVIILTNVEPSEQMINDIVKFKPLFYLVKSDIELSNLIGYINKTLKMI